MSQSQKRKGVSRPGVLNSNAKFKDPKQVVMLRTYRHGGWSHKDLAMLFGCSQGTSSLICRGKSYPNAGGPIETTRRKAYNHAVTYAPEAEQRERAAEVKALRRQGFSHDYIAGEVGVSKATVGSILRGETKYS